MGSSALDTVLLMCISLVFSKKEGPTLLLANLCLRWFYHFLIRFHIEFINGSGSLSRRTLATEITFSWMRFLFDVYTEKLVLSSPINLPWIFSWTCYFFLHFVMSVRQRVRIRILGKLTSSSVGRCPSSLQQHWARWPLRVSFNSSLYDSTLFLKIVYFQELKSAISLF